jgi:2-keto-3-deoxy-L-rhamnonate aldolase RhmA
MKIPALQRFRRKLRAGESVYGVWVTLEAAAVTDISVGLGLDWVVIDAEHGHLDWAEILEHVRATVRSNTVALVRLSEANPGLIKRALDIGADGIVIPRVETADQLRSIIRSSRHAPLGTRGIGDERATCWGHCFTEHVRESNANVLVVPILETGLAEHNLKSLLSVEGTDVFFFDPADYSADTGLPGELEGPVTAAAHDKMVHEVRKHGKHAGVVAVTDEALTTYRDRGFTMLGVGFDGGLILSGIRSMLHLVGRSSNLQTTFNLSQKDQPDESERAPGFPAKTKN